jgi:thiol:disulfide interchange protein
VPVEELRKAYGIEGVPTLLFIGADGQERKNLRGIGFISSAELLQKISSISK